jgi:iron complex transport system substrate-binding protein
MKSIIKCSIILILPIIITGCSPNRKPQGNNEKRIISLSPHITEIIYALGADKDLIAVSDYCKYPPQAGNKEKIGGLIDPNIEKIVSLAPTHLFGVPAHLKLDQELRQFNLHIIMLPDETVSDVIKTIDSVGQILGYKNQAAEVVTRINDHLLRLRNMKEQHRSISAMLVIGKEPGSLQNLMVAGPETFLHELWTMVGGINIFADLPVHYSTVNLESIIQRNPQVIIQFDTNLPGGIYKSNHDASWQFLHDVEAVRRGHIFTIGGDYVLIPGPRLVLLAQDFSNLVERVINE